MGLLVNWRRQKTLEYFNFHRDSCSEKEDRWHVYVHFGETQGAINNFFGLVGLALRDMHDAPQLFMLKVRRNRTHHARCADVGSRTSRK